MDRKHVSTPKCSRYHERQGLCPCVLAFIGLTDITIIRAEGLNLGDETKAAAVAKARAEIAALAA